MSNEGEFFIKYTNEVKITHSASLSPETEIKYVLLPGF